MNKFIIGMLAIIILAIFVNYTLQPNYGNIEIETKSEFHDYETVVEQKIQKMTTVNTESIRQLPDLMYSNIEEVPKDFAVVRYKFLYPVIEKDMDVCKLDRKHYNQPEFFLNFEKTGVEIIKSASATRHGISPYPQIYPSDQILQMAAGSKKTICTLLRTSYLTEFYIGMKPVVKYPAKINVKPDHYGIGGIKIDDIDPTITKKYINVKVTPNEFYLRPSYPVFGGTVYNRALSCQLFGCEENIWTKKLNIEVNIDKKTPAGYYVIGIDFERPTEENVVKWYELFGLSYKSVGGAIMLKTDRPAYQLLVKVI
jgi:hypothetical protein